MPSIKTITERLGEAIAHENGEANVRPIASMMRAMMKNATTRQMVDLALDFFNDTLRGYGVEAIKGVYVDCYYKKKMDVNLLYVNMGDTYTQTVIYDTKKEEFFVCSWGDIVEGDEKRFADS